MLQVNLKLKTECVMCIFNTRPKTKEFFYSLKQQNDTF